MRLVTEKTESGSWTLIRQLLWPYRLHLLAILAAMIVETVANLAGPWPLKVIIDDVAGHGHSSPMFSRIESALAGTQKMQLAALMAVAFLFVAIIGAVTGYIDNYITESVGQRVAHDLRMRTYHHLQRLSLSYYNTHATGGLLSTITTDIQTVQSFASSSTLDIVVDLLTIVSMLGLMFWLNWDFTLIALGVTPILLIFVFRFKKAVKKATREVRKEQSEIVSVVQQDLGSMQVIQAFGLQDHQEKELGAVSQAVIDAALKARRVKSLLSPIVSIVVAACTAVVLWRGAWLTVQKAMTIGALTVFLAYLTKFFKPVKDLATSTNAIAQVAVAVDRIEEVLDADSVVVEKNDAIEIDTVAGTIEFSNVSFGYSTERPVLSDVNFTIRAGQFIGIVGPTGAGKSTVVSMIPRFYDPVSGSIKIDGIDIRDMKLDCLRDQIGYVLQDTVLFRGTIAENIAFGKPGASEDEIVAAAKLANAHEFIMQMPGGYRAIVGERGATLSGGQRQRIGIARVMIRNSPILLLDEPTAALDTESERLVIDALERLMKGRTVIAIAHRLSTIRDADQIMVISGGGVAEMGSHDELMATEGIYATLHAAQFNTSSKVEPLMQSALHSEPAREA
ncbi:MAG TPA: ABC transporter ATP-binding protein [Acidobacteriaceae bacterium]|nr:ABC transporter ATP-binding protein [Acidobacteriaceae bacterium]